MIGAQLPALQVVIPLLAAPLCLLLYRPFATWLLTVLTSATTLVISALLLTQVLGVGRSITLCGLRPLNRLSH